MRPTSLCCILALVLSSSNAHADVITSNLGEGAGGNYLIFNAQWVAGSFTTDGTNYQLDSITAILDNESNPNSTLFSALYSDTSGSPGSAIVNLAIGPVVSTPTPTTLTPVSSTSLSANTTYWLVFGSNHGNDFMNVNLANSPNQQGPGAIGDVVLTSTNGGAGWQTSNAQYLYMSVNGTAIPEPATFLLIPIIACASFSRRRIHL